MDFNIDNARCTIHPPSVPKRLAIVEASQQQPVGCCTGVVKLRGKDVAGYATLFKVLGDETRLSILGLLIAKGGALCACHIEDYVKDLSKPTISHHLRLLREAGLVTAERKGTWVYYAVSPAARARLAEFVTLLG
jgi:ArsR family transcriptional regulator